MSTKLKACLALSLALNVVLGFVVSARIAKAKANEPTTTESLSPSKRTSSAKAEEESTPVKNWAAVSTDSPDSLARDLRSLGLPESLVQNAVTAAIDREFRERQLELSQLSDFWLSHDLREEEKADKLAALYALSNERRQAIRDTLSISWRVAPSKQWRGSKAAAAYGLQFGYLEPEKAAHAHAILHSSMIIRSDLEEIENVVTEEQLIGFREGVVAGLDEDFDAFFSPEERETMELTMYWIELSDQKRPDKEFLFELSPEDRTDLMRILKPDDYINSFLELPTTGYKERSTEIEAAILERFGSDMVDNFENLK